MTRPKGEGRSLRRATPGLKPRGHESHESHESHGSRGPGDRSRKADLEGWQGWDDYAAFYDWENARTVGRRDVVFWRRVATRVDGRTLELGCGTGRVLVPLARAGVTVVGIDRSAPMLARGRTRLRRLRTRVSASLVRGDVRDLPGADAAFDLVVAPYGILQSLLRERDLARTLASVARVLAPGGVFGIDLVPDVPNWREYSQRITMRGHRGPRRVPITLVESVRQDRARRLTFFDQEFTEGWGSQRRVRRFSLAFRTIGVPALRRRLERAGFEIDAVLGGYDGEAWDPRADTWVVMARRKDE
jgi:ubiquinone/menaquinone biosynthesis C-methylase UbiE